MHPTAQGADPHIASAEAGSQAEAVLSMPSQPPLQLGRYLVTKKVTRGLGESWQGLSLPTGRDRSAQPCPLLPAPPPLWLQALPWEDEEDEASTHGEGHDQTDVLFVQTLSQCRGHTI